MAEVTGGTPPSRGYAFVLAGMQESQRSGIRLAADELVRRPFPRSVCTGLPWGNAQLENLVVRCSGLVFRNMELGRSCLSVTDGLPAI